MPHPVACINPAETCDLNVPQMPPGAMAYPGAMPQYTQAPPTTFHHQQQQQHQAALKSFWVQQMEEIENTSTDPSEFKNHQLPLARIKKVYPSPHSTDIRSHTALPMLMQTFFFQIMKSDEDVRMISAEAPVLFAKVRAKR